MSSKSVNCSVNRREEMLTVPPSITGLSQTAREYSGKTSGLSVLASSDESACVSLICSVLGTSWDQNQIRPSVPNPRSPANKKYLGVVIISSLLLLGLEYDSLFDVLEACWDGLTSVYVSIIIAIIFGMSHWYYVLVISITESLNFCYLSKDRINNVLVYPLGDIET